MYSATTGTRQRNGTTDLNQRRAFPNAQLPLLLLTRVSIAYHWNALRPCVHICLCCQCGVPSCYSNTALVASGLHLAWLMRQTSDEAVVQSYRKSVSIMQGKRGLMQHHPTCNDMMRQAVRSDCESDAGQNSTSSGAIKYITAVAIQRGYI